MNKERTGTGLRQVEHICGNLWHRNSITVNHVMSYYRCGTIVLLAIVLSVFFRYMNSDYPPLVSSNFSYFWSLCCLFFLDIYNSDYPFGIFKLFWLLAIVLSVLFRYMNSDYLPLVSSNFSYFWPLRCLFFLEEFENTKGG
jgi:F0F1-type ATP synthase membrane subunit a